MSKQQKLDQNTFMHVKQRLDYYRLPSSFPIEVTALLSRLLGMLDVHNSEKIYQKENMRYEELKRENKDYLNSHQSSSFSPLIDEAMRMELSKHVKENNELHQEIMTLKQELSALKHVVSKTQMSNLTLKNTKSSQNQVIEEGHLRRERELFDELQDAKYKYNQVIDMVHSQSDTEHQYIKKLLKHKQYCSSQQQEINPSNNAGNGKMVDLAQRQIGKSIDKRHGSKSSQQQVVLLREKLDNREKQILRLRGKLQFDGLNMNRILKDFNQQKQSQERDKVMERVDYLQKESKKVKEENVKMKALGGDKQALREEIVKLKCENSELKRRVGEGKKRTREMEFSDKKEKTLNKRRLNETVGKIQSLIKEKAKEEVRGGQFQKKETIYSEKINELCERIQQLEEENCKLSKLSQRLQKQLDEEKLMGEYERQKYIQKEHQVESIPKSNLSVKRGSYLNNQSNHINTNDNTLMQNQQLIQTYKQQMNQMRHNLIAKQTELNKLFPQINNLQIQINNLNNQLQTTHQTLNTYKQHLNIHKAQNTTLKTELLNKTQLQTTISQLTQQLQHQKDLLQKEKTKNIKSQLQLKDHQQINEQFIALKEQYTNLQKEEKQKLRGLQYKIAQMQETINIKTIRNQEKQATITSLQTQLLESNNRLRQANKELSNLDQELYKLKIDNNRLEKKYTELTAEYAARQEKDKNHTMIKESQLMGEMETINRELQRNKALLEDRNTEIHESQVLRNSLQKEIQETQRQLEEYKQEVQNFKQRQQLYQMEIRQLKIIADSKHL